MIEALQIYGGALALALGIFSVLPREDRLPRPGSWIWGDIVLATICFATTWRCWIYPLHQALAPR